MAAKRLPWGHESRYCCRCGKVGPRCIVVGGWSHYYCLSDHEKRERRTPSKPARNKPHNAKLTGPSEHQGSNDEHH